MPAPFDAGNGGGGRVDEPPREEDDDEVVETAPDAPVDVEPRDDSVAPPEPEPEPDDGTVQAEPDPEPEPERITFDADDIERFERAADGQLVPIISEDALRAAAREEIGPQYRTPILSDELMVEQDGTDIDIRIAETVAERERDALDQLAGPRQTGPSLAEVRSRAERTVQAGIVGRIVGSPSPDEVDRTALRDSGVIDVDEPDEIAEPGEDFEITLHPDDGLDVGISDEFVEGRAGERISAQLLAEYGIDAEPGEDFEVVFEESPDDPFIAPGETEPRPDEIVVPEFTPETEAQLLEQQLLEDGFDEGEFEIGIDDGDVVARIEEETREERFLSPVTDPIRDRLPDFPDVPDPVEAVSTRVIDFAREFDDMTTVIDDDDDVLASPPPVTPGARSPTGLVRPRDVAIGGGLVAGGITIGAAREADVEFGELDIRDDVFEREEVGTGLPQDRAELDETGQVVAEREIDVTGSVTISRTELDIPEDARVEVVGSGMVDDDGQIRIPMQAEQIAIGRTVGEEPDELIDDEFLIIVDEPGEMAEIVEETGVELGEEIGETEIVEEISDPAELIDDVQQTVVDEQAVTQPDAVREEADVVTQPAVEQPAIQDEVIVQPTVGADVMLAPPTSAERLLDEVGPDVADGVAFDMLEDQAVSPQQAQATEAVQDVGVMQTAVLDGMLEAETTAMEETGAELAEPVAQEFAFETGFGQASPRSRPFDFRLPRLPDGDDDDLLGFENEFGAAAFGTPVADPDELAEELWGNGPGFDADEMWREL